MIPQKLQGKGFVCTYHTTVTNMWDEQNIPSNEHNSSGCTGFVLLRIHFKPLQNETPAKPSMQWYRIYNHIETIKLFEYYFRHRKGFARSINQATNLFNNFISTFSKASCNAFLMASKSFPLNSNPPCKAATDSLYSSSLQLQILWFRSWKLGNILIRITLTSEAINKQDQFRFHSLHKRSDTEF